MFYMHSICAPRSPNSAGHNVMLPLPPVLLLQRSNIQFEPNLPRSQTRVFSKIAQGHVSLPGCLPAGQPACPSACQLISLMQQCWSALRCLLLWCGRRQATLLALLSNLCAPVPSHLLPLPALTACWLCGCRFQYMGCRPLLPPTASCSSTSCSCCSTNPFGIPMPRGCQKCHTAWPATAAFVPAWVASAPASKSNNVSMHYQCEVQRRSATATASCQ